MVDPEKGTASAGEGGRASLTGLFREILVGASRAGLDVVGSMLVDGAWPVLKGALDPVLDQLSARFAGRDVTASPELAERAAEEFERDARLQELLRSSLLEALRPVVEGQERVETSLQSLYEVAVEGTAAAREVLARLDQGVALDEATKEQLAELVVRRITAAEAARAYARQAQAAVTESVWLDLDEIQSRATELQAVAIELIYGGRIIGAEAVLSEAQRLLGTALEETPTDPLLKTLQGFVYKTAAQAFGEGGHPRTASGYLDLAEGAFRLVLQDPPDDAYLLSNAWNGLGNVLALRADYPAAAEAIEKAVSFYPDNYAAWYDLLATYANQGPQASLDLAKVRTALENLRRTAQGSRLPEEHVRAVEAWAAELVDPQRTRE
jgi:tetratricopeptide (TPR) repeat protein